MGKNSFYCKYIKRILDVCCAFAAFAVFGWLYLIIAVLVRINLGSPIIFHQSRPGRISRVTGEEELFQLCKFRTMTDERDGSGQLLPDTVRLTKFGKFLRATSLDELPEAWNILKGDMSVIGPRPLTVSYLQYYTKKEHHRHDVRPGLSGLAQVMGRNAICWEDKFKYDLDYIERVSFFLDIKIVFLTIKNVLKRDGIGQGEEAPVSLSVERQDMEQCKDET